MAKATFAQTLKHIRRELEILRRERGELDAPIAKLEHVEAALRTVAGPAPEPPDLSSITNVVRNVVKSAIVPITPPEVRDKMVALGFDQGPYSQFLASYPENARLGDYYNSYRSQDLKSTLTYEESKAKEAAKYRR